MPDLMTHLLIPWAVGRTAAWDRPRLAIFCLGAVLPDLVSRAPSIALGRWPEAASIFSAFHTPIGVLILCLGLVMIFPEQERARFLSWLLTGAGLHLGLDLLQLTVRSDNYYWLFPLTFKDFQLGLFWPDQTVLALPGLMILVLAAELLRRRRGRP